MNFIHKRDFICVFVIIASIFSSNCFADSQHIEDENPEEVKYSPYDGIDVSAHQRTIDWSAIARNKNIKYVYIKATEGATYTSPRFEENIKNARKNGVKVGSYHFLRTSSNIREQAANFFKAARKNEQDIIPLIDIEVKGNWNKKQICDSLQLFANLLREHYGCDPVIYTSANFYNNYLWPFFNKYTLFIAKYSPSEPELKDGANWCMWQYTDGGRVNGITSNVDLSKFNRGRSVRDITYYRGGRRPGVIDEVDIVQPNMDMHMQTPNKFKSKRDKKAFEEYEKALKKEKEKAEKEAKKLREKEEKERKEKEKEEKKKKKNKDKNKVKSDSESNSDLETIYSTRSTRSRAQ